MQGPRLYRFFNYEFPEYLPAPVAGWNPDVNPWECPINQAPQLYNFLLRPGKIVMRGPLVVSADLSTWLPVYPVGAAVYWDSALIGRKVYSSTAYIDPWNAVLMRATSSRLAAGTTSCLWLFNGSAPVLATQTSVDKVPGPRWIDYQGQMYGISYDSAAAAVAGVNGLYQMKPLNLLTLTRSGTSAAPTVTVLSNAPHGAVDLIAYQDRIWLLGGIDTPGAGTVHDPTALFYTVNPLPAGGGSASADWRDPVAGTTNVIHMDGDARDFGVGLAVVRNGLLVLRRQSIYLLRGTTTANYALVPVSTEVGCVDARSIVQTDQGVYFMSTEGLMLTNGVTVQNVSGSVMHNLRAAVANEQNFVLNQHGGYVSCARTSHGQIVVSIGTDAGSNGSMNPRFCAMYDPTAVRGGAWVALSSGVFGTSSGVTPNDAGTINPAGTPGLLAVCRTPNRILSLGNRYVTSIEDQFLGQSLCNTYGGLHDQLPSGANPYLAIPASWHTVIPAITTAAKRTIGQAKRYYLDYQFAADAAYIPTTGWTAGPIDVTGVSLDSVNVPIGALNAANLNVIPAGTSAIMRVSRDWWNEVSDISFNVFFSDAARSATTVTSAAEVYGLGLEFQHSRESR